jgi:hypothetical protein
MLPTSRNKPVVAGNKQAEDPVDILLKMFSVTKRSVDIKHRTADYVDLKS